MELPADKPGHVIQDPSRAVIRCRTTGWLGLVLVVALMAELTYAQPAEPHKDVAIARVERLDYDSDPRFALATERYWAGARIRFWKGLATSFGVGHQTGRMTQSRRTAFDIGLTMALRAGL